MKRRLLLIGAILLCSVTTAQTGKGVGIKTDNPTETLQVDGTVRITDLPNKEAINKSTDGTTNTKQSSNTTKTLVVDENGVLGVVEGSPVTELPPTPEVPKISTIQYVTKTVKLGNNTSKDTEIKLGNLQVRYNYNAEKPNDEYHPISFKLIDITDNVICNVKKVGEDSTDEGGQHLFFSAKKNEWKNIDRNNDLKPSLTGEDFALYNINLLNTQEVYRLSVSLNKKVDKARQNIKENTGEPALAFYESPAQVTLFLERLTKDKED